MSDDTVDPQGGVRMVTNNDTTGVQQPSQPLVGRDPRCEPGEIRLACPAQVPFDPAVAEECRTGAEVQRMLATCGVRDFRPDVAADQLPGDERCCPSLDLLSFQGVDTHFKIWIITEFVDLFVSLAPGDAC